MESSDAHEIAPIAPTESERELLDALRKNDPSACEHFVRTHASMAIAVARRFLRNEADSHEAVQDAFCSFFRSLKAFRGDAALATWLHRIVVNAALMKRRTRKRRPESSIDDLLPAYYEDGHRMDPRPAWRRSTGDLVADQEVLALVRRKIDELPEDYRNVILLRDIDQIDTAEAARLLGDTPGAVKTRLHRARQALRTLLERELGAWNAS